MTAALRASFRTFFSEKEEHEENCKKILGILLDVIRQLTQEMHFYEANSDEVGIFLDSSSFTDVSLHGSETLHLNSLFASGVRFNDEIHAVGKSGSSGFADHLPDPTVDRRA